MTIKSLHLESWRTGFVIGIFSLWALATFFRAFYVQSVDSNFYIKQGENRFLRVVDRSKDREEIVDRNGLPISATIPTQDFYVDASSLEFLDKNLPEALKLLDVEKDELSKIVQESNLDWIPVRRRVGWTTSEKVTNLRVRGLYSVRTSVRNAIRQPEFRLPLGITSNNLLIATGYEKIFDSQLAVNTLRQEWIVDRLGQVVDLRKSTGVIGSPKPIKTALSITAQLLLHKELQQMVDSSGSLAGTAVIVDAETGEVVGLVGASSSSGKHVDREFSLHPAVLEIEPGSLMAPMSLAIFYNHLGPAAGSFVSKHKDILDAATGRLPLQKSGNGESGNWRAHGLGKAGLRVPPSIFGNALYQAGFGTKNIAFGHESSVGRVYSPERWSVRDHANIATGFGFRATLIQIIQALVPIAHPTMEPPQISLEHAAEAQRRKSYVSMEAAMTVRRLLEASKMEGRGCDGPSWTSTQRFRSTTFKFQVYQTQLYSVQLGWCRKNGRTLISALTLEEGQSFSPAELRKNLNGAARMSEIFLDIGTATKD
jgi:cell division protein FtsI (penicillin-binding protein 3)